MSKVEETVKLLYKKYGKNTYDFSTITNFDSDRSKVTIICKNCSKQSQYTVASLKKGISVCTCSKQSPRNRYSTEGMIQHFQNKFGEKYSYPNTVFKPRRQKIKVLCNGCNTEFEVAQHVFEHYSGGCPNCLPQPVSWSPKSIECLDCIGEKTGLFIQHAKNSKEHSIRIGKKIFKADGFIKGLNLVLEYNGDAFHGNPKLFRDDDLCNPYSWQTAKELYDKTMLKKKLLEKAGYHVLTIWENDYKKNKEKTIAKAVKFIDNLK